jgi:omega-hydroxy-beta-dihydromenaquinone-9 sulfotransferase
VHQPPGRTDVPDTAVAGTGDAATGQVAAPVRRIFVAGNSRSGTTMLAHMLGRHSAVFALQELHFAEELWLPGHDPVLSDQEAWSLADRLLHNQRAWYHTPYVEGRYGDAARSVVERLDRTRHAADVFAAVMAHEAEAAGKHVAVEQTPRNVFYLRSLLDRLPDSHAVVLTRDSRDVLLSQKNWWRRRFRGTTDLPWRTTIRQWVDYHPVTTSLIWRGGIRAGLTMRAHPRVTLLRFEDLVADPEGVLTDLLAVVGLQPEPGMLDVRRISSSNAGDRQGVGVDPSVVGQFRNGLSSAELWVNQYLTAKEAAELGYAPVPVRPAPARLAGIIGLWPVKLALAVLLNRGRSRSLLTSVRKRLRP